MNAMHRISEQGPRREAGLSLVELMISVTIAMLITIVMANLFLGSRESYRAIDNSSRIQENARYAQQHLGRTVRLAGFRHDFTRTPDQTFGTGVSAVDGTNGTGTASDSITVRFTGSGLGTSAAACANTEATACAGADGRVVDCLGRRIDSNIVSVNRFEVRTAGSANGGPALFCSIDGATWREIIPDIENMQVLYGEPTSSDLAVNRFLVAGSATMANVLAVRVALLHRSSEQVAATNASRSYDLLGVTVGPFTDSRIRSVTTTSIVLRNRAP
jgi:type IV pilus assembly protein PilW